MNPQFFHLDSNLLRKKKKKEFGKSVGVLSKKLMDLHPKLSDASRWNEKLKHKKKVFNYPNY